MLNRAEMFNRRAGNLKFKPNEIIQNLSVKRGNVIVDVGSGGGYYTMRLAAETGLDGLVYAVDINQEFLDYIDGQARRNGMINIRTILIEDKLKGLPEEGCDLIFLRNVYHHLYESKIYFEEIKNFLKPGGKIAIIDYKRKKGFNFISLLRHCVKEEEIISCLKKCGYEHIKNLSFLADQSFNIFKL